MGLHFIALFVLMRRLFTVSTRQPLLLLLVASISACFLPIVHDAEQGKGNAWK